MRPSIIGISGGIGSGKSVVSRILRIWGYPVFDCDSEAKALMDADDNIKNNLSTLISTEVVADGVIDRRRLAEIVFADEAKLAILNSIVHSAVRQYFTEWARNNDAPVVFAESAILHSSGMIADVDFEWHVDAPCDIRIERVCRRNGMTPDQVKARMASQKADETPDCYPVPLTLIINDNATPLLPQLTTALKPII